MAFALKEFSVSKMAPYKEQKGDFFFCGEEDLKYVSLYEKELPAKSFYKIAGASHALLEEKPELLANHLKNVIFEEIL